MICIMEQFILSPAFVPANVCMGTIAGNDKAVVLLQKNNLEKCLTKFAQPNNCIIFAVK